MKKPLWLAVCLLFVAATASAQDFKNLAGAPEEMSAMRLPSAETLGVRSKAAMLPVRFDAKGKWTVNVPVETSEDLRLSLLAPDGRAWQIKVRNGDGETNLRDGNLFVERSDGEVGLDGARYPAEVFTFDFARGGDWQIEISAPSSESLRGDETAGYLVISGKSPYQIYTALDTLQTVTGKSIGIRTALFETSKSAEIGIPGSLRGSIESAEAELRLPNGATEKLILRDAGEGVFKTAFVPPIAGEYAAQITVRGTLPTGEKFIRTSEQTVRVLGERARFGKAASANLIDDARLEINLPTSGLRAGRKVVVYGEVWGKNARGEDAPVAWLGGISVAEGFKTRTVLPVVLDGRWLARSDAQDGFELRNVRIQDADYFVTLAEAESIALAVPHLPEAARKGAVEITEEMRTGKRPEKIFNEAVGGKLMLVHGYCSGGNPFPVSQFSNYIVFSDPNQNRTHDQFAQLIRNFGAAYPSFGVVAHSQGGAATLHLYTYYWSGLDYATGNRLIQSVGTPYQGTALAGNLAALGSVFGAGCGTNNNLTYSGAASWLAGIPTWARAKVHYSTTSFTDVWWRYDYCNVATDLFLSDPDDGVVERAYAQLSGANNRGHKTGWCHTGGMRDPAQTSDSVRNADMNANAAR
jgi:hypothetical protein